MVDMHDVIAYIERRKVIQRQLLCLFDAAAEPYPVEAVEYLMVGLMADLLVSVDESGMDVLSDNQFRLEAAEFLNN